MEGYGKSKKGGKKRGDGEKIKCVVGKQGKEREVYKKGGRK